MCVDSGSFLKHNADMHCAVWMVSLVHVKVLCPCVVKSDLFGTTQVNQEAEQGDEVRVGTGRDAQMTGSNVHLRMHGHGPLANNNIYYVI